MTGLILEIGHAGGLGGWVDAFVCVSYKNWFDQYVLLKIHDCLWHVRSTSGWPRSARCGGQDLARTVQSCKTAQGCTDTRCAGLQHCVTLQDSLSIICLIGS